MRSILSGYKILLVFCVLGLVACTQMEFLWIKKFYSQADGYANGRGTLLYEDGSAVVAWDASFDKQYLSRFDAAGEELWRVEVPIRWISWSGIGSILINDDSSNTQRRYFVNTESYPNFYEYSEIYEYDDNGSFIHMYQLVGNANRLHVINNQVYVLTYNADYYYVYKLGAQNVEWQKAYARSEYTSLTIVDGDRQALYVSAQQVEGGVVFWQFDKANEQVFEHGFADGVQLVFPFSRNGERYAWLRNSESKNSGLFRFNPTGQDWLRLNTAPQYAANFSLSDDGFIAVAYSSGSGREYRGHVNVFDLEGTLLTETVTDSYPDQFTWLDDGRLLYLVNPHDCEEKKSTYWSQFEFLDVDGDKETWEVDPVNTYVPSIGYACAGRVVDPGFLVYNYRLTDDNRLLVSGDRYAFGPEFSADAPPFVGKLKRLVIE